MGGLVSTPANVKLLLSPRQSRGITYFIYFINLDRFKPINDQLGHQAGDHLLVMAGKRIRSSLRLSDTVGRLGGDEFLVIAQDIDDQRAATYVAEKISYAFSDPFSLMGKDVFCNISIGIALCPAHGITIDKLITNADIAMYNCKNNKAVKYSFFDEEMAGGHNDRLMLENDLRRAVHDEKLILHYQPKMNIRTGQIDGAEALIRWEHPTLGWVPPSEFIPLAEKLGLIHIIGLRVLRLACYQMLAWEKALVSINRIAINLSPVQFNDPGITEIVASVLNETGLPARCLELELTEGAIITDIDRAMLIMKGLSSFGIHISIDDFGTGYSSLSHIKHFPISTIKIDKSFVSSLENSRANRAIINTIIQLGKNLEFTVVAEGVETSEQLKFLTEQGCDIAQGYLIARPMDGLAFTEFVSKHRRKSAPTRV